MKTLARNKRPFLYCLYEGSTTEIIDEYGNATGEFTISYADPQEALGNISPATGESAVEMFGGLDNYDKVIVMDEDVGINTDAVLFVGKEYEETDDGQPVYNYTVRRVAKSLNGFIAIAIQEVKVNDGSVGIPSG